ncbi:uncharacterized protein I206_105652 [Kwoniella pini CBS 10737]|uniref:Mitochondrial ATPase complex subunit ATP10 n=1 Tax=Kwoniella pini CBS 10737 TaxID=1296096 RepID=A0A1B9I3M1_9TREE|nr:uncharacterized protein I206_03447 [Kwoniella pini CBS 10737]OCF50129.1 hypothetical protein I206_03447 [Kwoniella pini CBS 10737]
MPPRLPVRAISTPLSAARYASSSTSKSPLFAPKAGQSSTASSSSKVNSNEPSSSKSVENKVDIKGKSKSGPQPIPPLPRPLGISQHPTSASKTWSQRKQELLDDDRHKAKRKALVKEATQGYFHDYNRAKGVGGGKLWIAPNVLIREDKALYFPDISGKSLLGNEVHTTDLLKGRVTLVSVIATRLSEEHEQSFTQPVLEDVAGHPEFNFVQINHQENKLKSLLVSFFISSLKRIVPEDRWGSYMISGGEWSSMDITSPLGIDNKLLGYIYLVDQNLKVRWAGCGTATPEESQALRRATAVLLGRIKGEPALPEAGDRKAEVEV